MILWHKGTKTLHYTGLQLGCSVMLSHQPINQCADQLLHSAALSQQSGTCCSYWLSFETLLAASSVPEGPVLGFVPLGSSSWKDQAPLKTKAWALLFKSELIPLHRSLKCEMGVSFFSQVTSEIFWHKWFYPFMTPNANFLQSKHLGYKTPSNIFRSRN